MKTKTIIFCIVLLAVTVFNTTAQTTTTLFNNALNNISISFSPDGGKAIAAKDLYTNPSGINNLGLTKIFNVNSDYTMTLMHNYQLEKGDGAIPGAVVISNATISNDGTNFVYFRNDIDTNDDSQFSLVKNGVEIESYTNINLWSIESNDSNCYMLLASTVGGAIQTELCKIDVSTNNVEWQISQSGDRGDEILLNEGNPYLKMYVGNLIEYDTSNGNILSTISGSPEDFFQLNQSGNVEQLKIFEKELSTSTGITQWEYRFFTDYPATQWKTIDGYTYAASQSGQLYVFDENMEDVYKTRIAYFDWENNEEYITSYIYPNKSITYITRIGNVVYAKHYNFPVINVPMINGSANSVVSEHNEQVLTGSGFVDSNSFISTVVMNDSDLPITGDAVDSNLIVTPTGFTLLGGDFTPTLNSDGFAEFIYYKADGGDLYIRVKLYFKGTSSLGVENIVLDDSKLGFYNQNLQSFMINHEFNIAEGTVYDINGRIINKFSTENEVFLGNSSVGVYILRAITATGKVFNKKFIKH